MKIFKIPPGEISKDGCWVFFCSCYLHVEDTLMKLIWNVIKEWKNDSHLAG